jgi:hypothetical protein
MAFVDALKVELGSAYFAGVLTNDEKDGYFVLNLTEEEPSVNVAATITAGYGCIWTYTLTDKDMLIHVSAAHSMFVLPTFSGLLRLVNGSVLYFRWRKKWVSLIPRASWPTPHTSVTLWWVAGE